MLHCPYEPARLPACLAPLPLSQSYAFQWAWHPHEGCDVRRREWPEIGAVFANRTLAFTGDSHVRFVHNWIAVHLGGEQQLTQRRRRLPAPASWQCGPPGRPPGFFG